MADYYTHFSFLVPFDLGGLGEEQDERHVKRIVAELNELIEDANESDGNDIFGEDDLPYGILVEADGSGVWITDDAGEASIDGAVAIVRWLQAQPGSPDVVSFEWANTCSKPRLDAYGGGAVVILRGKPDLYLNTGRWAADAHVAAERARAGGFPLGAAVTNQGQRPRGGRVIRPPEGERVLPEGLVWVRWDHIDGDHLDYLAHPESVADLTLAPSEESNEDYPSAEDQRSYGEPG